MRQRISVLVFDWERLTAVGRLVLRVGAHLRQVRIVIVVANFALLSGFTVVNRGLNHRLDEAHARHDAPHRDELVDELSLEPAGSNMIAPKVALEIDIVAPGFRRERFVIRGGCLLLVVGTLARVVHHLLDAPIQLSLKHAHRINGILRHEPCQLGVLLPKVIDANTESLLIFAKHRLDLFAELRLVHILSDSLLEGFLLDVSLANHLVLGTASGINLLHLTLSFFSLLTLVACFFAHKN